MLKKCTQLALGLILSFNFIQSHAQTFSQYIVVDQFGYTTKANKVAIIRDPQTGFDASSSYTPAATYALVDAASGQTVFTASPVAWKSGLTDTTSGDKVWWFDFTSVETPGRYFVKELSKTEQSAEFVIADNVYKEVLKAAMRMLYYQRSSFEKKAPHAGVGWTDGASHLGPLQDKNARLYNDLTINTEKDLHGGWYDAGDLNKYTTWTANYVITLLTAYQENPSVFTDDFNIPESGNGVPDILDEVKWGIDHLLRMQQDNGSCLSVLSSASNSVNNTPSTATGQSKYGPATTNATLKCAEAFAFASKVYKNYNATLYGTYAANLQTKAIAAWTWADANPSKIFNNNSKDDGTEGVAAGNQETNDLGRLTSKLGASVYLYDLTGQTSYLNFFESNYNKLPLVIWTNFIDQYRLESQSILHFYLSLPGISNTVATDIKTRTITAINKQEDFAGALFNETDAYRSFIKVYDWGSNQYKANYGNLFWEIQKLGLDNSSKNEAYLKACEEYLHYIHGVNPFGLVYLTNMSSYGAENSAKEMYHTWFADGSSKWDRVGTSTYGPPPGFITGGANKKYKWDKCCGQNDCGWSGNTAICTSTTIPTGQPSLKSYKDFNTSWPLNSWELTETSLGYQTAYIRLLSKFTGTTGPDIPMAISQSKNTLSASVKPNPTADLITIEIPAAMASSDMMQVELYNMLGNKVLSKNIENNSSISLSNLSEGVYVVKVSQNGAIFTDRVVKMK